MKPKRNLISAAVVLALAAAAASPAHAVLARMGPIDKSPTGGGYPAWFQDATGVTIDFCSPSTQAELDGGWCVLLAGDTVAPESFPNAFFDEHFYVKAGNTMVDPSNGFKAVLTIALEGAFATGPVIDGDQMTFQRHRIFIPRVPIAGDYRVITPYGDFPFYDLQVGDRIFETQDIGVACIGTFECTLNGPQGPFLLPSAAAGGAEVPAMPDLLSAPAGTDPFFDAAVALGAAPTRDPQTGKKYIADPARIGPITGSPLPDFTAYDIDPSGATPGIATTRNHNTFRVEVRVAQPDHNGHVIYVADGETNFGIAGGRLHAGAIPGNVANPRSTYKADTGGNVTDIDVYAQVAPTIQSRIPTQPVQPKVTPVIAFYNAACGGALGVAADGTPIVNPPPYTSPGGTPTSLANVGKDFWGQSSPGGLPPSHVCIEDSTSRNAAGQVVPTYTLVPLTDDVQINSAHYVGPQNGTLTVTAVSSDPTAILTLQGYGPAAAGTPGVAVGAGAGTGLDLQGTSAQVLALNAPPSTVQVSSTKGGAKVRTVDTAHGTAQLVGLPSAVNDSASINEDCSATPAVSCAAGQGVTVDLLANDTVMLNGVVSSLRDVVAQGLATVTVVAQTPRLGSATVSTDGFLTYTPNPNANGTDNVNYTVTVDGQVSNQAVVAVNITPVNDIPVAANQQIGGVVGKTEPVNLLKGATDPDGAADVKDAVIVSWPAQLGPQPVPVNGVVNVTPAAAGNFPITFQVKDAAGALSANTATANVTAIANETVQFTKFDYTTAKLRWVVSGTSTVIAGQEMTIFYTNGKTASGVTCTNVASPTTATVPAACVVGKATLDGTGTFLFDFAATANTQQDPKGNFWSTKPTTIRAFSSNANLGGSTGSQGITFR